MTTATKTCSCKCEHTFTLLDAVLELNSGEHRFDDDGFSFPDAPDVYRWHDDYEDFDKGIVYIGMSSKAQGEFRPLKYMIASARIVYAAAIPNAAARSTSSAQ